GYVRGAFRAPSEVGLGGRTLVPRKQLPFLVDRLEAFFKSRGCLGRSQPQQAVRLQGIMKRGKELLLRFGFKIDHDVPAGEEIHLVERGIREQVMRGKDYQISDLFLDAVPTVFFGEEPLQTSGRDITGNTGWI